MIVRFTRVVSIVGVGVLVMVWGARAVSGQADPSASRPLASVAGKPAASFVGLTPLDYVEIKQLVSRYAYAVDTGADNGNVYASLFAPDGAFADRMGRETTGREALAALARRNTRGPQSAFHFIVNHVIEPTSDGAVGKEYLVQLRMGEGEKPNDIFGGGHYEDVYVKTPDGWRFKRRQFMPSEGSPRPRRESEAR
ncbi:MAG TPA: nuclear transport factor 2 family protein [Vicinamibacterales bacterium]|nr:nuclear transport factor 2 family protein [Vicinamibacterales bacterium]